MPLYEYQCESCGARFERIQKFSDPPVEQCPTCGGPVRKLVSSPAIQFKGTGWYITDYARSGQSAGKSGAAGEGGAKNEASDSGDKKGDKTTESKTDSKSSDAKSSDGKSNTPKTPAAS